jgi:hypothetical protein
MRAHQASLPDDTLDRSAEMSLPSSAHSLITFAAGGEHGGGHQSLNPYVTGGGALLALLLLLWIVTRFNRDR